jgi:hypothetical protein
MTEGVNCQMGRGHLWAGRHYRCNEELAHLKREQHREYKPS